MESLGYDEVKVDGLGNVMGFMGEGDKIIAFDSHIDTVGIGNRDNWEADPYQATKPTISSTAAAAPIRRRHGLRHLRRRIMKDLASSPPAIRSWW